MSFSTQATIRTPELGRIAHPGHLQKMARSGDRSQSRPSRAASATAAVREPRPELAADVRHVAVDSVVTEDQMCGNLLVAQPVHDQRQYLPLSPREKHRLQPVLPWGRSSGASAGSQCPGYRTSARRPTGNGRSPPSGSTPRLGSPPPAPGRGGRGSPGLHDDARPESEHTPAPTLLERRCRRRAPTTPPPSLGSPPGALVTRQPFLLEAMRFAQKHVGQQARPQSPVRAHRCHDGLAHLRGGDEIIPVHRTRRKGADDSPSQESEPRTRWPRSRPTNRQPTRPSPSPARRAPPAATSPPLSSVRSGTCT